MSYQTICPKVLFSTLILAGAALPGQLFGQDHQRRDHAQMQRLHNDPKAYIAMLEDPERDVYQKPEEVVRALDLQPGEVIADIGSGSGYFTIRFAAAVGETGRALGVDVSPDYLSHIRDALKLGGPLIIVDFFKKELPIGPGLEMKIAKSDVISSIEKAGFELTRDVNLLEYQYFLILEVKGQR